MPVTAATGGRKGAGLRRRSFFVDDRTLRRAKKALGVATDAEVVRLSMERIAEMEEFWQFMDKTRGSVPPDGFDDL